MEVGDVVECEVVEVGQRGAYVVAENGERGFIHAMELSWTEPAVTDGIRVGDRLRAKVMKYAYEDQFVASVREVHPERNPWADLSIYHVGAVFSAVVYSHSPAEWTGGRHLFVTLKTGAVAIVHPGDWLGEPPPVGAPVTARVVDNLDLENKRLRVTLR